jgi:hypothetical protein
MCQFGPRSPHTAIANDLKHGALNLNKGVNREVNALPVNQAPHKYKSR